MLVRNLSTHFWQRGHEVRIAACRMDKAMESANVTRLASGKFIKRALSREALSGAATLLEGCDVVHLHGPWATLNLQLARQLRHAGKPYVLTTHGNLGQWALAQKSLRKRAWLAAFGRTIIDGAAAVHFTSGREKQEAEKRIPWIAERAVVVPCMLDTNPYNSAQERPSVFEAFPTLRPEAQRVLFLGRLHPTKGPDVLIRALAEVANSGADVQLVLAGPGSDTYRQYLARLAQSLGLEDRILMPGLVSGLLKVAFFEWAQVMALPTHQESFGLALVESLAAGTPVITTSGVAIAERLRVNAGAIIARRRPQDFATSIGQVLSDPQKFDRRGADGRRYINDWLDMDKIGNAYETMYSKAIERGSP
jgi:glycosyltransferase involved in cell wall biosynthesis